MTVGQLRDALEGLDDETPVRLMTQSHWPFENAVDSTVELDELEEEDGSTFRPADYRNERPDEVFYLVEGSQLGYGTKVAWDPR